jgi:glycosyltransferase involved in cell wall biosynthesis
MGETNVRSWPNVTAAKRLPRVLCIARNYPNSVLPRLGLWTERLVQSCACSADVKVIAPVPYWPPLPGPAAYARMREVESHARRGANDVFYPRFLTGPGSLFQRFEAWPFYASVMRSAHALRAAFPFELIHAHFVYPDGWAGARLAQRYRVPLIITEHAAWHPWLDQRRSARRMALAAAAQSTFLVAVSNAVRSTIADFIHPGSHQKLRMIPNAVDTQIFTLISGDSAGVPNRLLFVGIMRHVKGLDVLLRAVRILLDRGRPVSLAVVGESFYAAYQRDYERVLELVTELRLDGAVQFLGGMAPADVAREMQQSALLVLPSRRETFGSVLPEALACGIPVVSTRCGGPEEIVDESVGVLVPPENPQALADGIAEVLDRRASYDPSRLRAYAEARYDIRVVGRQYAELYHLAIRRNVDVDRPESATDRVAGRH